MGQRIEFSTHLPLDSVLNTDTLDRLVIQCAPGLVGGLSSDGFLAQYMYQNMNVQLVSHDLPVREYVPVFFLSLWLGNFDMQYWVDLRCGNSASCFSWKR